ncbi:hypothetical protein [Rummeliibacillus pycnus]|uniref:hypothetical protein n=1 Tax=Rummeliibacillus pycnus TaxID=101070 RepID=UPI003D2E173A
MPFFKEEVYATYSLEDLSKIREILAIEGIKYSYRVKDGSSRTSRGNFGSFGMNTKYERQYVILVYKKDVEQAKYLIHKALNS